MRRRRRRAKGRPSGAFPPFGESVTRAIGRGSCPLTGSKRACRSIVASIVVASSIANDLPMQTRGPAPNGMYW